MKKEVTYEGKIFLKVATSSDEPEPKCSLTIDMDNIGQDRVHLIPALYDLLKATHEKYSILGSGK